MDAVSRPWIQQIREQRYQGIEKSSFRTFGLSRVAVGRDSSTKITKEILALQKGQEELHISYLHISSSLAMQ
jgi:hypothetical protein